MITLIIDTSTEKSILAFAGGKKLLACAFLPPGMLSSRYLMSLLEKKFNELQLTAASLKAVAVAIGPGSYTGMRVGVAAAKGLVFPSEIPLMGFCSLEGFVSQDEGRFASLIDARIGGAYVLLQERKQGKVYLHSSPQLIAKKDVESHLKEYEIRVGPEAGYPDPTYLAELAEERFQTKRYNNDVEFIYLRGVH